MVIELFGLPASGKTTLAKRWESEGWVRIRLQNRIEMFSNFLLFALTHPIKTSVLFFYCIRYAGGVRRFRLKINNLFFYNLAAWQKAQGFPRAIVDQGPHQSLLSLFETEQSFDVLTKLIRFLPKPNALIVLNTSQEVRLERLSDRGKKPRIEFGDENAARFAKVAQSHFDPLLTIFRNNMPWTFETSDMVSPEDVLLKNWSYVTFARMPTEKAHGVSIAHMCSSFAKLGKAVTLIIPKRKNGILESVFEYYNIPKSFSVTEVTTPDFLGRGLSSPFWFFIQRVFFLNALKKIKVPAGVVYTRDPEIAFAYARSHLVLFESHRMPHGIFGHMIAWMVRRVALVVCNSEGTQKAWQHFKVRTVVAPNGFDQTLFSKSIKSRSDLNLPEGFIALYAGSDQSWKGVNTLRDAAPNNPSIIHVVVGSSEVKQEKNLYEIGTVPPWLVPQYLHLADVLVAPNIPESMESIHYTSPIKLFEYMAAGKPIVASDLPSLRAILCEDALFFTPGDPHDLAMKIAKLRDDTELYQQLAIASRTNAPRYTWEARAKNIVSAVL